ncbi:unnamed protein product [Dovyalis caffra]|uniref:LysM domain-containing protein n=1 Tax=Dovyalis caffra TaxID=77055 RepID=A0AAV1R5W7_9ROSI|nr:unnamed protein product [Dovyalis caffra]
MEVKLSHRRPFSNPSLPKFHLPNPKTNFPSQSKPLVLWFQRWKFHIQDTSKGQSSTNPYLLHVVKEGETLSSISKQYGVSIYSIASANKNIMDVDLVSKGQLLNIPASAPADTQTVKKCELPCFDQLERLQSSMKIMDGFLNQKCFITVTTHSLPHAKATGYFLVLVPVIAFCIRCIIGAFHTRARRDLGFQASNESGTHHDVPKSKRWKYALSDMKEPDNFDGESVLDSTGTSADQDQNSFEEVSHAYNELEQEYQKFLSECGISNSGYWRGGDNRNRKGFSGRLRLKENSIAGLVTTKL